MEEIVPMIRTHCALEGDTLMFVMSQMTNIDSIVMLSKTCKEINTAAKKYLNGPFMKKHWPDWLLCTGRDKGCSKIFSKIFKIKYSPVNPNPVLECDVYGDSLLVFTSKTKKGPVKRGNERDVERGSLLLSGEYQSESRNWQTLGEIHGYMLMVREAKHGLFVLDIVEMEKLEVVLTFFPLRVQSLFPFCVYSEVDGKVYIVHGSLINVIDTLPGKEDPGLWRMLRTLDCGISVHGGCMVGDEPTFYGSGNIRSLKRLYDVNVDNFPEIWDLSPPHVTELCPHGNSLFVIATIRDRQYLLACERHPNFPFIWAAERKVELDQAEYRSIFIVPKWEYCNNDLCLVTDNTLYVFNFEEKNSKISKVYCTHKIKIGDICPKWAKKFNLSIIRDPANGYINITITSNTIRAQVIRRWCFPLKLPKWLKFE